MLISVITVCRDAATTIADTIRSVAAQDHNLFEHIIVDGASSDNTQNMVAQHAHDRLIWISEPDEGLYDAMNKGLRLAKGELLGFLNADDAFAAPDVLSALAEGYRPGLSGVMGDTVLISPTRPRRIERYYDAASFRKWQFKFGQQPPHPSIYLRREEMLALGGFRTNYRIAGDFELLLRLWQQPEFSVTAIARTITAQRIGGVSTSGFQSKRLINKEIGDALRKNGVTSHAALLWARYALKWLQYVRRPTDLPSHWTAPFHENEPKNAAR